MASLREAMKPIDKNTLIKVDKDAALTTPPSYLPPQFSPFLRCPMPVASSSDAQRQYYRDGVPQARIIGATSLLQQGISG